MLSLLSLLILVVPACNRQEARNPGPLRVVVTVPPLAGLVRPLLPSDASLTILMAPGRSEHGYEFAPEDLARLGTADLVVYVGLHLEPAVEAFLDKHPRSGREVVCFAEVAGVQVDHDEHSREDHDHDAEHTHAIDPHPWLDPGLCIQLVDALVPALGKAAHAAGTQNWTVDPAAQKLKSDLGALDGECASRLAPLKGRVIVTHHNAWQRFADRYGLSVAAVIRANDAEPTPGSIAAARDAIATQNATAIFVEPQYDSQVARRIADAAHVNVGVLDPLGHGDYFAMMRGNVDALVNLLGK